MRYPERLFHFIWRYRLYDQLSLQTIEGECVKILTVGQYNEDAGPDFEFAQVRIGDTLWSGHVEIHVDESDWELHKHQQDKRYDATILHVVWNTNKPICRTDGTRVATIRLADYVSDTLLDTYHSLMESLTWIPCENHLSKLDDIYIGTMLDRASIERLESKYEQFEHWITIYKQDWERILLISLGRSFGMRVNASVFEQLMKSLDNRLLLKYRRDTKKMNAMLFGQAGFLNTTLRDAYSQDLQREYTYLSKIHDLKSIDVSQWKFLRMRPYNFPTYRLAQLAAMLSKVDYWFSKICEVENLEALYEEIKSCELDKYWLTHFHFGKESKIHMTNWSDDFLTHLTINSFAPMLFVYGKFIQSDKYIHKAIAWLSSVPPEQNAIIRKFSERGIIANNAMDSQAVLHLKRHYCDTKQCLSCTIGLQVMKFS